MAIRELSVFPQITLSENQGMVGVREWTIDAHDDEEKFLDLVCQSHFPNYPDSLPIQIQSGAFWKEGYIRKRSCTESSDIPPLAVRTVGDIGALPDYGVRLVVAQYALHRMTNCWPTKIPKPYHPSGTTLSLHIRGSGQSLLVTPAGLQQYAMATALCDISSGRKLPNTGAATKVLVPVAEYQVSCDRLTKEQVDAIFALRHWDLYQGCVNGEADDMPGFLGAYAGTLLFDGYDLSETFVCDRAEPTRYRLTATLKHRVIIDRVGAVLRDTLSNPVGWNHDYTVPRDTTTGKVTDNWAWTYIAMWQNGACLPRYTPVSFSQMFGAGTPACQPIENPNDTVPLTDGDCYAAF